MARIGFIGLGNMGLPMAGNLVKAGHQVLGFDLVDSNIEKAVARKVEKASAAAEVAKEADCVITMLPAGKHVLGVYGDIAGKAKNGALFIDSSTIDVESARKAHAIAAEHGIGRLRLEENYRYKSPVEIGMMAAVKMALDPKNIMNPGKVLRA